jgi:HAD superfamily hydrolase (TIGR01509 family)
MPPELAIFDCDGVLVDSEPIANRVLSQALIAEGLDTDYAETTAETTGLSMASVLAWAEGRLGRGLPAGFVERVQDATFAAFRRELAPVPGVSEALARIELPVCVASSGEIEKIRLSLGLTGLLERFEGRIFSAAEVARGKPFPDLFLHAAQTLGVAPKGCAVIEDSLPGVRAARAAGMTVLGYAGAGDQAALAAAGAHAFTDMAELPDLLRAV